MIKSEKKLAELRQVLEKGKHADIEHAIVTLRNTAPFEGALLLLASFYDTAADESVQLIISEFFNDLKDNSLTAEVVEALLAAKSSETTAMLAASCWQSGLDYSAHAGALADLFIMEDFKTSLECFTILENCSSLIPDEVREAIISMLEKEKENQEKAKQQLTNELILVLKI